MDKSLIWSTNEIIFSFLASAPKWKWYRWKEDITTQSMITFLQNSEWYILSEITL